MVPSSLRLWFLYVCNGKRGSTIVLPYGPHRLRQFYIGRRRGLGGTRPGSKPQGSAVPPPHAAPDNGHKGLMPVVR